MAVTGFGDDANKQPEQQPLQNNDDLLAGQAGVNQQDVNYTEEEPITPLLLGAATLPTINSVRGSDYTNNIAKALKEIYNNVITNNFKPVITVLDKEKIQGIAYSSVVVSILQKNELRYFTIQLEATGRKTITVGDIVNELANSTRNPNTQPNIYTVDDGLDPTLFTIIEQQLVNSYNFTAEKLKEIVFINVDGVILHASHPEFEEIAANLARLAYNAAISDMSIGGKQGDLNIAASLHANPDANYVYKANVNKTQSYTELGLPVRADWKVDLYQTIKHRNMTSINLQTQEIPCSRTCGYIDVLPEEIRVGSSFPGQYAIGNEPKITRYHPHIIITATETQQPTVGYLLLSIVNSLIMCNQNMWLSALKPTDPKNHIGILNTEAKIDQGVGEKLDLTNKSYTIEQIYNSISQMVSLPPVVSIDIDSFGPQSSVASLIARANGFNTGDSASAAKLLVYKAHELTGGLFPSEYPINDIFYNVPVILPNGKWSDKTGERDLRDIDYIFIANHTDDKSLLSQYALSEVGIGYQNLDTYLTRVAIINKFVSSAEVISKTIRCTFTNNFILTLTNAICGCGLNVRYTPEITTLPDQNLSIMSALLQRAGLTGLNTGFAQEFIQSRPNFMTPYTNMGMRHF